MGIVQKTRFGWLWTWLNGSNDSSQVRQCGKVTGISFQDLGDTRPDDFAGERFTPVTGGKGSSQSGSNGSGIEDEFDLFFDFGLFVVEFSPDDFLGGLYVTVLELVLEEANHQGAGHV